jgi:transcriptional regulator with XRE-family HTH domain
VYNYRARGLMDLLNQQGRKQRWLANQVGVSESHLSRVVAGERLIDQVAAERISSVLAVPLFLIFEFTDRSNSLQEKEMSAA